MGLSNPQSDVYSFGVVALEVLSGKSLYAKQHLCLPFRSGTF